jgi:hypothetical protein
VRGSKSDSKAFGRLLCSRPKAKIDEDKAGLINTAMYYEVTIHGIMLTHPATHYCAVAALISLARLATSGFNIPHTLSLSHRAKSKSKHVV